MYCIMLADRVAFLCTYVYDRNLRMIYQLCERTPAYDLQMGQTCDPTPCTQQICFAPFGFLYYRPWSRRCMGTEYVLCKLQRDRFHRLLRTVFASTFAAIVRADHAIWYRIPCPVYNIVKFFFANTWSIIPENCWHSGHQEAPNQIIHVSFISGRVYRAPCRH